MADSKGRLLLCILFSIALLPVGTFSSEKLRVISANIWTGLDYKGTMRMGEYETAERRKARLSLLIKELRLQKPDVVFLQEVNYIAETARLIADSLGYDEIHFASNPGIKIASFGVPSNLMEGQVILAKKEYDLVMWNAVKLSGPFGIFSDNFSIQAEEAIFALIGRIIIDGSPFYLADVHLCYSPDSIYLKKLTETAAANNTKPEFSSAFKEADERAERRHSEFGNLKNYLSELDQKYPVIISGDFNTPPEDNDMKEFINDLSLTDTYNPNGELSATWDPANNENVAWSSNISGDADEYDKLCGLYDGAAKRIDYILLSSRFNKEDVLDYKIIEGKNNSLHFSDHYAVCADISLKTASEKTEKISYSFQPLSDSEIEPLPLAAYDSDLGFGYGVKVFFLNQLKMSESFDLTAFNTTKGERWYRFAYSMPDLEKRQGKIYPLAVDLVADYDKYIKNNYFRRTTGTDGKIYETYTKEPLEFSLTLSRGFRTDLVGQAGLRFRKIWSYNFENGGEIHLLPDNENNTSITFHSLFLNLRYDTRNSFRNPDRGVVLQGEGEFAPSSAAANISFSRYAGLFQFYTIAFYPKTVFALRFMMQSLSGGTIPLQVLLSLGGNNTLRGFQQDRYLGRAAILTNAELRCPVYKRLTGILGADAGRAFSEFRLMGISDWKISPVAGLRLNMDNFIVRLDAGFAPDNMGLYFNFGHLF